MKNVFLIFGWLFVLFGGYFFWDIVEYNSHTNKMIKFMSRSEMMFSVLVGTSQAIFSSICFGVYAVIKAMEGEKEDDMDDAEQQPKMETNKC